MLSFQFEFLNHAGKITEPLYESINYYKAALCNMRSKFTINISNNTLIKRYGNAHYTDDKLKFDM